MRVEVYMKPSCSLCERAKEWLTDAREKRAFELVEHDIYDRPEWFAHYRYDIPVVVVDGVEKLKLKFTQAALETVLSEERIKNPPCTPPFAPSGSG